MSALDDVMVKIKAFGTNVSNKSGLKKTDSTRQVIEDEVSASDSVSKYPVPSITFGNRSTWEKIYDGVFHFYCVPKRYILAVLILLGLCNVYAMRVNFSVAIVSMVQKTNVTNIEWFKDNVTGEIYNETVTKTEQDFAWTSAQQGVLLSSFFWGYIITQIPGGWLATRFGAKHLFGASILSTAIFTILTPICAQANYNLLLALRFIEGFCEGVAFPCMISLWGNWAPLLERSILLTISFSGSYVGTTISLPLSAAIATAIGWQWIFYIFGIVAIVWYVFWLWVCYESPEVHPTISDEEREYIIKSRDVTNLKKRRIPWKGMLTSVPVLAISVAHFAEMWGFYTLLTELPTFLTTTLNFNLSKAGFLAALPYLVMVIMIQVGGQIADFLRTRQLLSVTKIRKLLTGTAFLGQTVFMLITAFVMTPTAAVVCLVFAVGTGGLAWAGFDVNMIDIAPKYVGIIYGISNTIATVPGIVSPTVAGQLTPDQTPDEWRKVFYISAAVYFAGAIFYIIFASSEKASWAEYGEEEKTDDKKSKETNKETYEATCG